MTRAQCQTDKIEYNYIYLSMKEKKMYLSINYVYMFNRNKYDKIIKVSISYIGLNDEEKLNGRRVIFFSSIL